MLRGTNLIQAPYEKCGFTMLGDYLDMPKVSFPTLGVPASGKTFWLAATYRQIIAGNYPRTIRFGKVKSPMAQEFDQIVNHIYEQRAEPKATFAAGDFRRPLVFSFEDHDPLGKLSVLVNIFDYAGEVTSAQTLDDRQRRRALEGNGFLFFVDPTNVAESQSRPRLCRISAKTCGLSAG